MSTPAPPAVSPAAPARPAEVAAVVLVLTELALLPRVLEPLGRDQAVFALVGRLMTEGWVPYRDVFEHKPPGLLAAYALVAPLGAVGPALLDTAAAALTAGLVAGLCAPLGRAAALGAGLVYAMAARHPSFGGFWAIAQPEPLQDLALAWGAWAATRGQWTRCGVALAAALALKFTLVAAVPVAAWAAWPDRRALARLGLGLAVPVLGGLGLFAALGAGPALVEVLLEFNLRHAGVGGMSWAAVPAALARRVGLLAEAVPGLWALAALGAGAALRGWVRGARGGRVRASGWALAVLGAALAQAVVQRKLWPWHVQASVGALAVLAGLGLAALPTRLRGLAAVLAVLSGVPGWVRYHERHPLAERLKGALPEPEWLATYTWGRDDFSAVEVAAVGMWLEAKAQPGDGLLVWGFEPGITLRSGLRPTTRWIYDYPLTVALPEAEREEGLAEVLAALPRTRWWVVMRRDRNALEREPSDVQLRALPALAFALDTDYTLVQEIGDAAVYRRLRD